MSPGRTRNNNILNNLKNHVDSGDVLFVVSDVSGEPSFENAQNSEVCNIIRSKCPGRRKLNRNFQGKAINASQFDAICDDPRKLCKPHEENDSLQTSTLKNSTEESTDKVVQNNPKRKSNRSNSARTQEPNMSDKNWRRKVILSQMKNHTISSAINSKEDPKKQMELLRSSERLENLQNTFENFVGKQKWDDDIPLCSRTLSTIMNRIGFSKYGYKVPQKSPYATNKDPKKKRKSRSVVDIVVAHNCSITQNSRVPSYMGWYWTKSFHDKAYQGWRPGAIPKNVRDIMCYFNGPCSCMPYDSKTCPTYHENHDKPADQVVARKPTLKVVRKDGLYFVSMNPLKPSKDLNQNQNPYMDDCPPIKFQIALNRQNSEMNKLGLLGYPCSDVPALCGDNKEMQNLLKILSEECQNDKEFYNLAKTLCSKESDFDIEFIAPGANLKDKKNQGNAYQETQYDQSDFDETLFNALSASASLATVTETTA